MEKILPTYANTTIDNLNTLITDSKLASEIPTLTQEDTTGSIITTDTFVRLTETINKLESKFSNNCCQSVNTNCCQTCESQCSSYNNSYSH